MLLTLLIALAASVLLALLGLVTGLAAERAGASARLRARVWTLALILPAALAPAALVVESLDIRSPLAVVRPLTASLEVPATVQNAPAVISESPAAGVTPAPAVRVAAAARPAPISPIALILTILLAGAALALIALALRFRRLAVLVAGAVPCGDGALSSLLGRQAQRFRVAAPALMIDPKGGAPMLAGVLKPAILLPASLLSGLAAERLALICAHELAHLKRRDNLKIMAESLLTAIFWFNPALRWIQARLAAAREEICDDLALEAAETETRRAYAQSLFSALSLAAQPSPALAFTGHRTAMLRRRLKAILKPVRAPVFAVPAALALGGALMASGAAASIALAASPPVRAQAAAVVSKAVATAADALAPDARLVQIAQTRATPAKRPTQVRFQIRVVHGPERMYADFMTGERPGGFFFAVDPTLRSTYEDGPVMRLDDKADLDTSLGRYSRNELSWNVPEDSVTPFGYPVTLRPIGLRASMSQVIYTSTSVTTVNGSPDVTLSVAKTTQEKEAQASANAALATRMAFLSSQGATVQPNSSSFELTLNPSLRADGRVSLTLAATSSLPGRPIQMTAVDDGPVDAANPTATPQRAPYGLIMTKKVGDTVEWHKFHYVQTGEVPPLVRRVANTTLILSDRQVVAVGGISMDPRYPAPSPRANDPCCDTQPVISDVILVRVILE